MAAGHEQDAQWRSLPSRVRVVVHLDPLLRTSVEPFGVVADPIALQRLEGHPPQDGSAVGEVTFAFETR
jgi:hypothetical protein